MKIIAQTDNRICIELTREDMEELDITYDELDYANIETRRVLWTLLDEARHELGRNICLTQRLLIEAVPDHDGGCSIFFTVMEQTEGKNQSKQLIKGIRQRIVCTSDKIDNIGKLSKALSGLGGILKSELYGNGGKYRLIIQMESVFTGDINAVICEFCDIEDDSVIPYTYEHWKRLMSPDAVGILCALQ